MPSLVAGFPSCPILYSGSQPAAPQHQCKCPQLHTHTHIMACDSTYCFHLKLTPAPTKVSVHPASLCYMTCYKRKECFHTDSLMFCSPLWSPSGLHMLKLSEKGWSTSMNRDEFGICWGIPFSWLSSVASTQTYQRTSKRPLITGWSPLANTTNCSSLWIPTRGWSDQTFAIKV